MKGRRDISPSLGGKTKKPTDISKRQIKRVTEVVRETAGSGNTPWDKLDLEVLDFKVEAKTIHETTKSMGLKREWIETACREAVQEGKEPGFIFSFEGMEPPGEKDWAMIPLRMCPWLKG